MASKPRAKTPQKKATPKKNPVSPFQVALQETLQDINSDPRVMEAMNSHLMEMVSKLRVENKVLREENEALKAKMPEGPKPTRSRGSKASQE